MQTPREPAIHSSHGPTEPAVLPFHEALSVAQNAGGERKSIGRERRGLEGPGPVPIPFEQKERRSNGGEIGQPGPVSCTAAHAVTGALECPLHEGSESRCSSARSTRPSPMPGPRTTEQEVDGCGGFGASRASGDRSPHGSLELSRRAAGPSPRSTQHGQGLHEQER